MSGHHPGQSTIVVVPMSSDRWPQLDTLACALPRRNLRMVVALTDSKPFNRGRAKNVGYLESGAAPGDSLVFHDVDIVPLGPLGDSANYSPLGDDPPTVRHLYGHDHCLGGVVMVRSCDFVRANGFPNGIPRWGGEDRQLELSLKSQDVHIDRSQCEARFAGRVFLELDKEGQVQTPQQSHLEFSRKIKPMYARIPPCNLDQTTYRLLCPRESMVIGGVSVTVIRFV